MGWSVDVGPILREDMPGVLAEHRVSRGGSCPDFVVDMIAAEVGTLAPNMEKAKVTTSGHLGSGSPRHCRFSVEGSS